MSKNLMIAVVAALCLTASIWGSVVDQKRVAYKEQLTACRADSIAMQAQVEQTNHRAEADIARMKEMLKHREKAISSKNKKLNALKQKAMKADSLAARFVGVEKTLEHSKGRILELSKKLEDREQALAAFQERLNTVRQENKAMAAQLKTSGGGTAKLQQQLVEANKKAREAVKQVAVSEAKEKTLRTELAQMAKKISLVAAGAKVLQTKQGGDDAEKKQLQQQLVKARNTAREAVKQEAISEAKLKALRTELARMIKQSDAAKEIQAQAKGKEIAAKTIVESAKLAEPAKNQEELSKRLTTAEAMMKAMKAKLIQQNEQIRTLNSRDRAVKKYSAEMEKKLNITLAAKGKMQQQIKVMGQQTNKLAGMNKDCQQRLERNNLDMNVLLPTINRQQQRIRQLSTECAPVTEQKVLPPAPKKKPEALPKATPIKQVKKDVPCEATRKVASARPVQAETPVEAAKKVTPAKPVQAETPVEAAKKVTPAKPVQKETPAETAKKAAPAKPVQGEEPQK